MKGVSQIIQSWKVVLTASLVIIAAGQDATAQYASIGGLVRLEGEYWPAPGVNLQLKSDSGLLLGAVTNRDGEFLFSRLVPGEYLLTSSFIGFKTQVDSLRINFGDEINLKIELNQETEVLETVEVVAASTRSQQRSAGVRSITPGDLENIPTPDVSGDLMASLLTMPGVTSPGDRGGQLFVRGGTPTQNLILIDGIPVFQPFHILGFYSAFPADVISYADVYAGGFGAKYGGRLSSVIDVQSRNGDKKKFRAGVSMAPFLSALRLEGPLVKDKFSFLVSARESVIERLASGLIDQNLPYRFGDQLVKAHAFLSRTSSASFTLLRSFDEGNLGNVSDDRTRTRWTNQAVGVKYFYLPEDFPAVAELSLSLSELKNEFGPAGFQAQEARARTFNANINFSYLLGVNEFRIGVFTRGLRFDHEIPGELPFREFLTEGGIFTEGTFKPIPAISINTGVRVHGFPSRSSVSVEPRLRLEYRPSSGVFSGHLFSLASGIYRQEIIGIADQRDVANVFTIWSSSPQFEGIPEAIHLIGSWSADLTPWFNAGVELYTKQLKNLTMPSDPTQRQIGDGEASGIEFRTEIFRPSFYAFASYSLASVWYKPREEGFAFAQESFSFNRFRPPHDRRHIFTAVARYNFGKFSAALRFQYGSGLPFTQVLGFFDNVSPILPNGGFQRSVGDTRIVFAEPFQGRLPSYHSLDITLERHFRLGLAKGKLLAGLINTYNRDNLFFYDAWNEERINQLPLVPTLGLKLDID